MSLTQEPGLIWPALEVTTGPALLLVLGDQGSGDSAQTAVGQGLAYRHGQAAALGVLLLGDNFYPAGVSSVTDPQFDTAFRNAYPAADLNLNFYVVTGNHDYMGHAQAEYDYTDPEGRWNLDAPGAVLPVKIGGTLAAEVFLVDSMQIVQATDLGQRIVTWALARARSSTAPWRILALHHPARSSGSHGDTPEIQNAFNPGFTDGTFQLVLAGHDHDMEALGTNPLHVVAGAGYTTRPITPGPDSHWSAAQRGFVELAITASGIQVNFWDSTGKTLLYTRTLGP